LIVARYRDLILLKFGMKVRRILEASISSSYGVLLSIPFTCPLKALTSVAEVILFLEIDLSNLFLSIGSLTEATGLSKMNDGL